MICKYFVSTNITININITLIIVNITSFPWEGALYKWLKALLTLCIWRYINEVHLHSHPIRIKQAVKMSAK